MRWLDVDLSDAAAATVCPADEGGGDTPMDSRRAGSPNGDGTSNLVDNDDDGDGIPTCSTPTPTCGTRPPSWSSAAPHVAPK